MELENKVITWYGYYGPDDSPDVAPAIEIFADRFGGTIEYTSVAWEDWADKLAELVLGGTPPDITPREDQMFPYGIANNQYEPLDDYIDLSSPLWSGVAGVAEQYVWNGNHYYYPWTVTEGEVLIYERGMMEQMGFDDPKDLYDAGTWTWDVFKEMVYEFVDQNKDLGENVWGYCGTANSAANFIATTGKALIMMKDGKLQSFIQDEDVERAMTFLEEMKQDGVASDFQNTNNAFVDGKILFYGWGGYALTNYLRLQPEKDFFFVPYPRDPNADKYYTPGGSFSYLVLRGAPNVEGAVAFLNCCRLMMTDEEYLKIYKDFSVKGTEDVRGNGFTDEMWDMTMYLRGPEQNLIVNLANGFSADVSGTYLPEMYAVALNPEATDSWTTIRSKYESAIQLEIDSYNDMLG